MCGILIYFGMPHFSLNEVKPALQWMFNWLLLIAGCIGMATTANAEKYLSAADAQKICFPAADDFRSGHLTLTPEQSKLIQDLTKKKVPRKTVDYAVASNASKPLGIVIFNHVIGKHELIDYAVALSPKGEIIQVEILEYREHYGAEIRRPTWRDQFKGKTPQSTLKLHDTISNISGATISCRNVTEGIQRVLVIYDRFLRPELVAAGRLP